MPNDVEHDAGHVMTPPFLAGGGACADLIASRDWSTTSLGRMQDWPQSLQTATAILLRSPVPIVMLWGEDGIMLYNDAYSLFAGGRHPELLGSRVREGWPEVADFNDHVMSVGLAGGTLRYKDQELTLFRHGRAEQVFMDLDYSPVLAANGKPAGVICFLADTTERVRGERALRASEAKLRELNETLEVQVVARSAERDQLWKLSQDMLARADYSGMMSAVSPAWTLVLGWSEAELLARSYDTFMHPDDLPSTLAAIGRMAETHLPARFENRIATRNGGWKHIEWTVAPEPDGVNFIAVGRDLSHVKAREAELEMTQEALRQAQKMEAVGQLTGGIAHDFNNLLTGVIGSLDMMQRQVAKGDTSKIERYATTAMTSANRAAALTHRLLAFSRRQPLDPKPVDANRLVSGMEELLRRTIGESVSLGIVTAGGLWQTLCDPHQLESAILNLAINARDAMPDGGVLTIETCNAHLDDAYVARQRDVKPGQYICICVTDTGTGMTKDTIEKAFEPFFTTKPIGQGTGLGLSMIYGFARQSEGYARIYSEVGQGTTMKLYLPRYYGEVAGAELENGQLTDAHRAGAGEVVLVIEDEAAVRDLVVDVLEELGYRAIEATDGPSGLAILQSKAQLDLLITDIGLPGLNGRQVVDAARHHRPDLRVLFMTGYAENAAIANGFLEPGMEMITKPFAVESIATRIRDMLRNS